MDNKAFAQDENDDGESGPRRHSAAINIHRDIMRTRDHLTYRKNSVKDEPELWWKHRGSSPWKRMGNKLLNTISISPYNLIVTIFPIVSWLPKYSLKTDLLADVIAGVTVFALNIPQGLSYSKLAGADPINGIYLSIFPVVVYAFMGTSRHVSIGTFAVISIACKEAVNKFDYSLSTISNSTVTTAMPEDVLTPIDVLTSLCLLVGIIQFVLGTFRLGVVGILLSDTLVSSFVVASACHVFTSQVLSLLGLPSKTGIPRIERTLDQIPFELIRTYASVCLRLDRINWTTVMISTIAIAVLLFVKSWLEPFLIKKYRLKSLALPIDILVIIIVTLISSLLDFSTNHGVAVIPKIPKAFENLPQVPRVNLFPKLIPDALIVSFVAYVTTYSLGKIFAKKHNYETSSNQELIALGSANIASSFFLCYPCSGSLARSAVQERVGGRTQVTSFVSTSIIIVFLLFFSRYLAALPQCVLASIIVVALLSTLRKISEFKSIWKTSKVDGLTWLACFVLVILFGVGNGLIFGLIVSLVLLLAQLSYPRMNIKCPVSEGEVFLSVDHENQNSFVEIRKSKTVVVTFDLQGALIFINTIIFQSKLESTVMKTVKQALEHCQTNFNVGHIGVIFDCSQLTHIDRKGIEALIELNQALTKLDNLNEVNLLLANLNQTCFDMMKHCRFFDHFPLNQCFMTCHDAFVHITQYNNHENC